MTAATMTKPINVVPRWRAVAAASVGNALEWFDFVIYGFFAGTMAKLFFPTVNETVSLLLALATFGVTFFMRPLGAIVIGNYADRNGRKAAFTLTIFLMMIGTTIIAVAPTYAAIGVFAPLLIVAARMIQGFSAGGEFGSATAFLAEQNPEQRGLFASWQFASQGITTILATAIGVSLTSILSTAQIESWGWRVPFLIGLLIGPVAYYIRRHVDETMEFQSMQVSTSPLREALSDSKKRLLVSLGAVVLCTVAMYTVLFMPTYATRQLGLTASGGFLGGLLTGVIQVALIPVFGAMSDRVGRLPIAFPAALGTLVLVYPLFSWLAAAPTLQTLLIAQGVIGVLSAAYMGPLGAMMSELFPARMRTTGLSISYAFGVAIFGGFAPFINAWLIEATGSKLAPAFYLMFASAISLVALVFARRLDTR
ncbi:MFS transporter [Pseudorhodoplanes sp.]|uniref:MFS transporter n=1 Tax=Pseudorhodoplanes sp. TaxID=1934341 RepID=UPI002D7E2398|nr:MFS transporter [Pseudorhodoplanes sp.]